MFVVQVMEVVVGVSAERAAQALAQSRWNVEAAINMLVDIEATFGGDTTVHETGARIGTASQPPNDTGAAAAAAAVTGAIAANAVGASGGAGGGVGSGSGAGRGDGGGDQKTLVAKTTPADSDRATREEEQVAAPVRAHVEPASSDGASLVTSEGGGGLLASPASGGLAAAVGESDDRLQRGSTAFQGDVLGIVSTGLRTDVLSQVFGAEDSAHGKAPDSFRSSSLS